MLNQRLDLAFHALSVAARREMVARLAGGPLTVSEIARSLPISLPAVLQHLAVLEAAGLVDSQKAGRVRTCRLNAAAVARAERWLTDRRVQWESRLDQLADYLASNEGDSK